MMHICMGLVGPKSGNVEKPLVLNIVLKGSKGAKAFQECKQLVEKCGFFVEKATNKNEQKEER